MDNQDIYEVERNDYAGFIGQLNKEKCEMEQYYDKDSTIIKIKSKSTQNLLCMRIIPDNEKEKYYIFKMSEDDERIPPAPIRRIVLENKDEVQAFFDILNKIQRHEKND